MLNSKARKENSVGERQLRVVGPKCAEAVDKKLPAGEIEARKAIREKKTRKGKRKSKKKKEIEFTTEF